MLWGAGGGGGGGRGYILFYFYLFIYMLRAQLEAIYKRCMSIILAVQVLSKTLYENKSVDGGCIAGPELLLRK